MRPFLRVHHLVLVQLPCRSEILGALRALMGLVGSVTLHMGVEPSKVFADFATFGTFLRTKPLYQVSLLILNPFFGDGAKRRQLLLFSRF